MDARWIVAIVFACILCYAEAQLLIAAPTSSNIYSNNCGCSKLCMSSPAACEPLGSSSCFFASAQRYPNNMMMFEISGSTSGYVALGLSPENPSNGKYFVFVCSSSISNLVYPPSGTPAVSWYFNNMNVINSIQSAVSKSGSARRKRATSGVTQCSFLIGTDTLKQYNSTPTSSTGQLGFLVSILTGDMTSETELGMPTRMYFSQTPLDLMDSKANGPCKSSGSGSGSSGSSGSSSDSSSGSSGSSSDSSSGSAGSNSYSASGGSSSGSSNSAASLGIHALVVLLCATTLRFL